MSDGRRRERSAWAHAVFAALLALAGCQAGGGAGRAAVATARAAPSEAERRIALAQASFARRDLPGAIAELDRALEAGETPEARILRGRYRGVARRFDDAVADLAVATERWPGNGEGWCTLAAAQTARGDEWEARRAFARALEVMERPAAVDRVWTLLLSMAPDPIQPQEALDRCTRGRAAALEGRWDEAQHEQLNGLRKATRFEWCIAGLAESTWRLGDPGRAEGILRRLVASFDPAHPELLADARGKLAELLVERGEPATAAEAAGLAREALAARPDRPHLVDVLARACDAAGDPACAREAFARLLARPNLPPGVRERAEARARALAGAAAAP
jgi:tetratricopeptide (TPR) repeat protein